MEAVGSGVLGYFEKSSTKTNVGAVGSVGILGKDVGTTFSEFIANTSAVAMGKDPSKYSYSDLQEDSAEFVQSKENATFVKLAIGAIVVGVIVGSLT